jgi:hypothetical protein
MRLSVDHRGATAIDRKEADDVMTRMRPHPTRRPATSSRDGYNLMHVLAYAVVYLRDPSAAWPNDLGDDPAFEAALRSTDAGSVVTWGVCRRRLRNRVVPGDVVVFFAADRLPDRQPEAARYQFVGYATVDRKVSQLEIWQDDKLSVFRGYRNLLIRPSPSGYEHFEDGRKQLWHDRDWLWRMTDMHGVRLHQMRELNDLHRWRRSMTVQGRPVPLTRNYVLFMPEGRGTFLAADPAVVAQVASNGRPETWVRTGFARRLHALVLGNSQTGREGLRTRNQQQAHPEIRLLSDPGRLVGELDGLCAHYGVAPRVRPHG